MSRSNTSHLPQLFSRRSAGSRDNDNGRNRHTLGQCLDHLDDNTPTLELLLRRSTTMGQMAALSAIGGWRVRRWICMHATIFVCCIYSSP